MTQTCPRFLLILIPFLLIACDPIDDLTVSVSSHDADEPTVENAVEFVLQAESQLETLGQEAERMGWVYSNFITTDTEKLAAISGRKFTARQVELAVEAAKFNDISGIDPDTRRKLNILKSGIVIPAPSDAAKTAEQSEIGAKMGGMYGKGEYCYADGNCLDLGHLSDIMAESRDPDALLEAWNGWRTISPPMKDLYARQVVLANEGASELGFSDLGTMWRSAYDMPPEDFPGELDRLWGEVKPLFRAAVAPDLVGTRSRRG